MLQQQVSPGAPSREADVAAVDTVARELLSLGWLVQFQRSTAGQTPVLLISRSGFDATPATVHVLDHHRLGLEVSAGHSLDIGDLDHLHHRLHDLHRRTDRRAPLEPTASTPQRSEVPPTPLPVTPGGFTTVLADPPWRFANRTGKVAPEHCRLNRYSTMTLEAVQETPVSGSVSANAHLYLWVPNALLPDGLSVMQAWGFRYVSNVIWVKRRKDGEPDGRGVGFYFRNVTEVLLFGVRGSMRTLTPARRQVNLLETRKREHSRKPDEQYGLIEACSPGPYLELFARHPRAGWTTWGDEAGTDATPRDEAHRGYTGGPIV